ncbi:phosphoglycerate mutase-like protein [Tilletiaria anomala UBC 951]|uniref:Phosphoglycerate mutase-like protein n=1 Tax=Tilletiaria anomala (strain ATCC 24038 / CBS 436.72 / UBC 951) TaxID=1037660 RepID=A0A066WIQ7_TILAU|nr:phosphoglycerate mutase-like protein [Tilletiaria anomala UBC 951]KDN52423.1 phosphoglycerate mutase-like protein [Tilletiaria anomala UBC 951]
MTKMQLLAAPLLLTAFLATVASSAALDIDGDDELNWGLPAHVFYHLGQYGPRFAVDSQIEPAVAPPLGCHVVFVNSLERHGVRHFTSGAYKRTVASISKLHTALQGFKDSELADPALGFFRNLTVSSTTDSLVPYGALQAYYSGRSTREVYRKQSHLLPFIRASGDESLGNDRVIVTAKYWRLGFSGANFPSGSFTRSQQIRQAPGLQKPDIVFSERSGQNNTLDVKTCTNAGHLSPDLEDAAQEAYGESTISPVIGRRLASRLAPAKVDLTYADIMHIMGLCSFKTLSNANITNGKLQLTVSPVCGAFNATEWKIYGYANSVGKYAGAGYGNPYYKALGQGFLRELYARLDGTAPPLSDPTSLNSTLGGQVSTFPLPSSKGHLIYFDGSHDNNIGPIAAAFGLFDGPALTTGAHAERNTHAWDFARIAPLQGKIVFEKLICAAPPTRRTLGSRRRQRSQTALAVVDAAGTRNQQAYVRVRANAAVQNPEGAPWCPTSRRHPNTDDMDYLQQGLCPLEWVLEALSWVNTEDEWAKCFT